MAAPRVNAPVQLSTLDRLLDEDPTSSREQPRSAAQSLELLRQAVRRDLEGLLNTRMRCQSWPAHYRELDRSVVGYGMPDYMSLAAGARAWREGLRAAVESIIKRFEPRLTNVSVQVMEDGVGLERVLHFRIDAMINVDPAPESVTYDSQVDQSTRLVIVTGR